MIMNEGCDNNKHYRDDYSTPTSYALTPQPNTCRPGRIAKSRTLHNVRPASSSRVPHAWKKWCNFYPKLLRGRPQTACGCLVPTFGLTQPIRLTEGSILGLLGRPGRDGNSRVGTWAARVRCYGQRPASRYLKVFISR